MGAREAGERVGRGRASGKVCRKAGRRGRGCGGAACSDHLRRGGEREGEVQHRQPVLVRVERREDQRRRRLSGLADAALGAVQLDKAARHPQLQPDVRAGGRASLGWLVDRLQRSRPGRVTDVSWTRPSVEGGGAKQREGEEGGGPERGSS